MKVTPTYRVTPRPLDYVDIRLEAEEARLLYEQLFKTRNDPLRHVWKETFDLEVQLDKALRGETL